MVRFFRHYRTYRGVGLTRNDAFRFAWLVTTSGIVLAPSRLANRA